VRIYATASGTRSVIDNGFERDKETGEIVTIDPWKYHGTKGTKITSKFIKHADAYGFPDSPQGFSFWAWRTDVKQYQIEVTQNCTKTVNFIECHTKDTVRIYQTKYLLSQAEVDFMIDQFKRITKPSKVLNKSQFFNNLDVFGLNWKKDIKYMPKEFRDTMIGYFNNVHEDYDNETLSMDEFFLLFMRIQLKLTYLNEMLSTKGYGKLKERENYVFRNEMDSGLARWRVDLKIRNKNITDT